MNNEKLNVVNNLFEGNTIRSVWNYEKEDYYFSVVDVIKALTDSVDSRKYWSVLKLRLKKEGSQLTTKCSQLKMKASDGKFYNTDVLDTEGIFRLIESVPSKKAEPFKLWLAKLGRQEIDNIFDPSQGIDKMRVMEYKYIAILDPKIAKQCGISEHKNKPILVYNDRIKHVIIKKPDYIFYNTKTKGLEYYKKIDQNICVTVRINPGKVLKVKSWYPANNNKIANRKKKEIEEKIYEII